MPKCNNNCPAYVEDHKPFGCDSCLCIDDFVPGNRQCPLNFNDLETTREKFEKKLEVVKEIIKHRSLKWLKSLKK